MEAGVMRKVYSMLLGFLVTSILAWGSGLGVPSYANTSANVVVDEASEIVVNEVITYDLLKAERALSEKAVAACVTSPTLAGDRCCTPEGACCNCDGCKANKYFCSCPEDEENEEN